MMMILLFSIYRVCIFKSFLMFESDIQCYRCVNHPVENTLCFTSFIIFVSMICIIACDTSSLSNRWMCLPQRRCLFFFTWHLFAIGRPGSGNTQQTEEAEHLVKGQLVAVSKWSLTPATWKLKRKEWGLFLMVSPVKGWGYCKGGACYWRCIAWCQS